MSEPEGEHEHQVLEHRVAGRVREDREVFGHGPLEHDARERHEHLFGVHEAERHEEVRDTVEDLWIIDRTVFLVHAKLLDSLTATVRIIEPSISRFSCTDEAADIASSAVSCAYGRRASC